MNGIPVSGPFCTLELFNADNKYHIGPCLVFSATISGDGAAADCDIYDGSGVLDTKKHHLETASGTSFQWSSTPPVLFEKGIYVDLNASTTAVMITYIPISRLAPATPVF